MHILQAIRCLCQLSNGSVWHPLGLNTNTYKRNSVCVGIFPNELVDVSIVHPLGNHRKLVFAKHHPEQWRDVWMPKVFPGHHFFAKTL